jgi:hypothetical protein
MKLKELKAQIDELIASGNGDLEVFMENDLTSGFLRKKEQSVSGVSKMVVINKPNIASKTIFDTQEEAKKFVEDLVNDVNYTGSKKIKTEDFVLIGLEDF